MTDITDEVIPLILVVLDCILSVSAEFDNIAAQVLFTQPITNQLSNTFGTVEEIR